jgi:hypothetical protein
MWHTGSVDMLMHSQHRHAKYLCCPCLAPLSPSLTAGSCNSYHCQVPPTCQSCLPPLAMAPVILLTGTKSSTERGAPNHASAPRRDMAREPRILPDSALIILATAIATLISSGSYLSTSSPPTPRSRTVSRYAASSLEPVSEFYVVAVADA